MLAAQADARWDAKPRVMDAPVTEPPSQRLPAGEQSRGYGLGVAVDMEAAGGSSILKVAKGPNPRQQVPDVVETPGKQKPKPTEDPWERARGPSEGWQPEAWNPTGVKK